MTERIRGGSKPPKTVKSNRDVTRSLLRLGVAAGVAVVGARSISKAVAQAWVGSRTLDVASDALTRSVR